MMHYIQKLQFDKYYSNCNTNKYWLTQKKTGKDKKKKKTKKQGTEWTNNICRIKSSHIDKYIK